jgi:hypothetical protein
MRLKDLIQGKKPSGSFATATHATGATDNEEKESNVARVATVSVANPWEGEIEEAANDTRQQRVEEMLTANPELKYAVLVDDATTDPVIVTVGIRGLAVFDLEIPHAHYDGLALLQILEERSLQETTGANTQASTEGKERSLGLPDKPRKTA